MTFETLLEINMNPAYELLAGTDFTDLLNSPDLHSFKGYVWKIISTPFLRFDWWDVVGLFGQMLFFSRFIVQWIASEKKKRTIIPVSFWYFSISGAIISLFYFVHIGKLPLIAAGLASLVIYGRNLHIWFRRRIDRKGLLFATGTPDEDQVDEASS